MSEVFNKKKKTPYDSIADEYRISFIPDETVSSFMLGIKIGSDDDNMAQADIGKAIIDDKDLSIKNGLVDIGDVTKGKKVTIRLKLTENGRKTLEVRGYAEH